MQFLIRKITGVFLMILLSLAMAPNAYALYSPRVATEIGLIKQRVLEARQFNGTGSGYNAGRNTYKLFTEEIIRKSAEDDKKSKEEGELTGLPGQFHQLRQQKKAVIAENQFINYGENFAILFFSYLPTQTYYIYDESGAKTPKENEGTFITSCLRDDIFELEDVKDAVMLEALRSSLIMNTTYATALWNDYKVVRNLIALLKTEYNTTSLLFNGTENYYTKDCPMGYWGDFKPALEDLKESWETFTTLFTAGGIRRNSSGDFWGNIKTVAESRAKVRASEWIAANQLSLTIGGPEGGSPNSLVDLYRQGGMGLGGVASTLGNQLDLLIALSKSNDPIYDPQNYNRDSSKIKKLPGKIASDIQFQLDRKSIDLSQAETMVQFNLEFNTLAETGLVEIEKSLRLIDGQIRAAAGAFGQNAGQKLPSLCEDLKSILNKQCPNKGGTIPSCQ